MHYSFHDIVDIANWQTIQNNLSEVLKVTLRTLDTSGELLNLPSISARACEEIMRSTPEGMSYFKKCLGGALTGKESKWKDGYQCPLSFYNFLIPLKVKDQTIAYLQVGPVVIGKHPALGDCAKTIESLNVDPERFYDAVREMRTFSFYGIRSVVELLYDIGLCVCQMGYQNSQLKGLLPRAPLMAERLHEVYREKLLKALLEVSCDFAEADQGSIMLLDERNNELYIKMAKGLSEEIINTARLKLGEGLAGIVAEDGEALLIGDAVTDERIGKRLNNPQLKNSILIPLKRKNKLFGVLNVASYKEAGEKFTVNSVETIDKLAELVETTLADFPHDPLS